VEKCVHEQSPYAAEHSYIVLTRAQAAPTNEEPVQGTHDVFKKQLRREHSNTDAPFGSEWQAGKCLFDSWSVRTVC